jgi:hypothetical protein
LTKEADAAFFARNFNLAQMLTDQEKFYIPTKAEVTNGVVMGQKSSKCAYVWHFGSFNGYL